MAAEPELKEGEVAVGPDPPPAKKRPRASAWIRAIDRTGAAEAVFAETGHGRAEIAVGDESIWVAHEWGRSLARLDRETLEMTGALDLGKPAVGVAAVGDSVWVLGKNGWLWRVEPAEMRAEGVARLGSGARAFAGNENALWGLRKGGELTRLDPSSGDEALAATVSSGARRLTADADSVWVSSRRGRALSRIDPGTGDITAEVRPPGRLVDLALDGQDLWIVARRLPPSRGGALLALDSRTGELRQEHKLDHKPTAVAAGFGATSVAHDRSVFSDTSTILIVGARAGILETLDEPKSRVTGLAHDGKRVLAISHVEISAAGA